MSLRLFSRAPRTQIMSWSSATWTAGDSVSVLMALLIVTPSLSGPPSRNPSASPDSVRPAWSSTSQKRASALICPEGRKLGVNGDVHGGHATFASATGLLVSWLLWSPVS